ncbi:MAG: helical backbone metal receptor [Oceanococcaceae bacterium]
MPDPQQGLTDDLGRDLRLSLPARSVISLCPSITETVAALAPESLQGRTRYCIHLASIQTVPEFGGTKNPRIDAILQARPDLLIAEKEENRPEDVAALEAQIPVYVFDVCQIDDALQMIQRLGVLLGRAEQASDLLQRVQRAWQPLRGSRGPERVLYLIWRKPWMGVGAGTYIHSVLDWLGYQNVLAEEQRYPSLDLEQIRDLKPQRILLSSEPYPFTEEHARELRAALPGVCVDCVDGEAYSWYGVRMLHAAATFSQSR